MEQARERLVELLLEVDYIASKDPSRTWWEKDVAVGAVNKNYQYYKYLYCINENQDGENGVFFIDYKSIWSFFEKENNISDQQIKDLTKSTLGDHYNFGDITTTYLMYLSFG